MNPSPSPEAISNPQKQRKGLTRVLHATGYSFAGLKAGWGETAFRQEAVAAVIMVPLAFVVGSNWVEVALLVLGVLLVMIVELLNTAVESTVDRIGPEWHALAKRAKDLGSAAVLLSLLFCVGVWATALFRLFSQ